jgi:hypothetical protein
MNEKNVAGVLVVLVTGLVLGIIVIVVLNSPTPLGYKMSSSSDYAKIIVFEGSAEVGTVGNRTYTFSFGDGIAVSAGNAYQSIPFGARGEYLHST